MKSIELEYSNDSTNRIHVAVRYNDMHVCALYIPANLGIQITPLSDNRLFFECGWGVNESHFMMVADKIYFNGVQI